MGDGGRRSGSVAPLEVDVPAHGILLRVEHAPLAGADGTVADRHVGTSLQADRGTSLARAMPPATQLERKPL